MPTERSHTKYAQWLRDAVERRGIDLADLGRRVNSDYNYMWRLSSGQRKRPGYELAVAIGKELGDLTGSLVAAEYPLIQPLSHQAGQPPVAPPSDDAPELIRVRDEEEAQVIHSYRGIQSPDDKAFVRQMLEKMRKMDRESSIGGQSADDLPDTSERSDGQQKKNR
jgi:hypothetical protein